MTKNLLDSVSEEFNVALDFIEHEVGPIDFVNNWPKFKAKRDINKYVEEWLTETGTPNIEAKTIIGIIDQLAANKVSWLTPFTRRLEQ